MWGTSWWDVASLRPQTSVPLAYAAETSLCFTTVPSQIHTAPPVISFLVWRWPRHFSSFPPPPALTYKIWEPRRTLSHTLQLPLLYLQTVSPSPSSEALWMSVPEADKMHDRLSCTQKYHGNSSSVTTAKGSQTGSCQLRVADHLGGHSSKCCPL